MYPKKIFSHRFSPWQNYALPIIYEWEDDISKAFDIPVVSYNSIYRYINRLKIHTSLVGPAEKTFRFVINGRDYDEPMNNRNIVPCIIDFFEREDQLDEFYSKHSKNKIVLLSTPFDYYYLKEHKCSLKIGLFAYSISDRYSLKNAKIDKKYDIVLTGRQDPLLFSFFKEYIKRHPDVTYVKRGSSLENDTQKTKAYYLNGKECLGTIETREEFMKLQSQGRVSLYGVQGYIPNNFTTGFYHMTPHFLEIVASASHVIARYPSGADGIDARFYEFDKFSPSVESFEEFESAMDKALNTEVDMNMYSNYLKKHYTSVRAKELKTLLSDL